MPFISVAVRLAEIYSNTERKCKVHSEKEKKILQSSVSSELERHILCW